MKEKVWKIDTKKKPNFAFLRLWSENNTSQYTRIDGHCPLDNQKHDDNM